jgi:hypothetical protein
MRLAGNESGGPGTVRLASAAGRWVLAVAVLAWVTISDDVLSRPHADTEPVELPPSVHCAVAGTPLAPAPGPRPPAAGES